jgi:predicted thioesterase
MVKHTGIFTYVVAEADSVRAIGRSAEFTEYKPPVMASARLIEVCEWLAMEMLRDDLEPHECSLGVWQHARHSGPIAIGSRLRITVERTSRRGRYSEWDVVVRDEFEEVGHARLGFVAVHQEEFTTRRVHAKVGARPRSRATVAGPPGSRAPAR